jgi:predicted flap endonuclease-1-like 5' DNA nuclease
MKPGKPSKSTVVRSRDWAIHELPGLDTDTQTQLFDHGIASTLQLWQRTATATQRAALAMELQIHPQHVNKWAALANLSRLPSVGCRYCGLLLHAGIASPSQLAQTPFQKVHQLILRLQVAELRRRDLCPTLEEVSQWVHEAAQLESA